MPVKLAMIWQQCNFLYSLQNLFDFREALTTTAGIQDTSAESISSDVRNAEMFLLLDVFDSICKIYCWL